MKMAGDKMRKAAIWTAVMCGAAMLVQGPVTHAQVAAPVNDPNDPKYLTAQTRKMGGPMPAEQLALIFDHLDLALKVFPDDKRIEGVTTLSLRTKAPIKTLILDLFPKFTISAIYLDGKEVPPSAYSNPEGQLRIALARPLEAGAKFEARVVYSGTPPLAKRPPWEGGTTWVKTPDGKYPWIDTSLWGGGCDLLYPCLDHPTLKPATSDLHYTVPSGLMAPGNGALVSRIDKDGWTTWNWHARSVHTYGSVLDVGPYKVMEGDYKSRFGNTIPMRFYYLPGEEKPAAELFAEFPQTLDFWENVIGPYPWADQKMGVIRVPYLRPREPDDDRLQQRLSQDDVRLGLAVEPRVLARVVREPAVESPTTTISGCTRGSAPTPSRCSRNISAVRSTTWRSSSPSAPAFATSNRLSPGGSGPRRKSMPTRPARAATSIRRAAGSHTRCASSLATRRSSRRSARWSTAVPIPKPGNFTPQFGTTQGFLKIVNDVTGRDYQWFFDVYLYRAALPKVVVTRENEMIKVRWQVPDNLPFPMPLDLRVDGKVVTLPMTDGTGETPAGERSAVTVDPWSKILMQSDAIDRFQAWRAAHP